MNKPFLWVVPPGKYVIAYIFINAEIPAKAVFNVPKGPGISYIGTLHISFNKNGSPVSHEVIDESDSVLTTQLSKSRNSEVDIALMKYDSELGESDLASSEQPLCKEKIIVPWWLVPAPLYL